MPVFHHSLAVVFALATVGMGAARERRMEPGLSPSSYPLSRYLDLWDTGWFAAPAEGTGEPVLTLSDQTPFPFVLVGLAELKGRRWVYLRDSNGGVVELTFGRPVAGLSLVRVEAGSPPENESVCLISLGGQVTALRFAGELWQSGKVWAPSRSQVSKQGSSGRYRESFGR